MSYQSERLWYLELKNKGLERQLESFRSGSRYLKLRNDYESVIREKDALLQKTGKELAAVRRQIIRNREQWFEACTDREKEFEKILREKDRELEKTEKRALKSEKQRDDAIAETARWRHRYYELSERLEELEGLNKKLTARVNKDFRNSSLPSSVQGPKRKKIPNTRPETVRKRGGQKGHEGHRLTQKKADKTYHLPEPEKYMDNPAYYLTGEKAARQKIVLNIGVEVVEYTASVFRNRETGSRVHADFPPGFDTDISYDSSVKAFAFLLANEGHMSAGKIRTVLREASAGKLDLSEATINGLCREFSGKSKEERAAIITEIMMSPALNIDFTNANVNGETKQVLIIASPSAGSCLYVARGQKGHKGIEGTPVREYAGTLIHDHDTTFYKYGTAHQECIQHNLRYLTGSEENEPDREWNTKMHGLLGEMIHYKNSLDGKEPDEAAAAAYEKRYDDILKEAEKEYADVPPGDYYRDGYNLYLRLVKYKESELRFLHDKNVPADNSLAERLARQYKRKQKQAIVFRSGGNFSCICDSLSVIATFRRQEDENLYHKVAGIFERPRPQKDAVSP